jgi:poly-gamma-glutamate system protein
VLAAAADRLFAPAGFSARIPAEMQAKAAQAENLMKSAESWIRHEKTRENIPPQPGLTHADSALIGAEITPLVTTLGSLEAKRLSTRTEWARELTLRISGAGVRPGDAVAAGLSGSFPGLNLALAAACQSMGVRLISVASVTASTWGANEAGFTWPEMESRLVRKGILEPVSVAISPGGAEDQALDLEPEGRLLMEEILKKAAADLGCEVLRSSSLEQGVDQRMELYDRLSAGRRLALYVNIGGGEISMGRSPAILRLRSGFIPQKLWDLSPGRGVMARFAERGVPVLTLLNVRDLALRWRIAGDSR